MRTPTAQFLAHILPIMLRQERILLCSSLNSSRTVSLSDRHLGFSVPSAKGQQAIQAREGGGWQPRSSGSPEAAKLRLHMFQQPALLALHHYSSVKLPPSTSCCPQEGRDHYEGWVTFPANFPLN